MIDIESPKRSSWTPARLGFVLGFLLGAGGTATIFFALNSTVLPISSSVNDLLVSLEDLIVLPGAVVADILGFGNHYTEGFDWIKLIFPTITNGLLVAFIGLAFALLWTHRSRVFISGSTSNLRVEPFQGSSALRRRIYKVACAGFGVGVAFTLLNLLALVLSRGETTAAWIVLITAPFTFAPARGFAHLFGFELHKTLDSDPLLTWLYLATFNGAMIAVCSTGLFALSRLALKPRENLHDND